MRTLRLKLLLPDEGAPDTARRVFDRLSDTHADQAIFQINQTPYVAADDWGFQVRYETTVYTRQEFVQSTSPAAVEAVMARVAPDSFERRVDDETA
jgi:hypothetical protein